MGGDAVHVVAGVFGVFDVEAGLARNFVALYAAQ